MQLIAATSNRAYYWLIYSDGSRNLVSHTLSYGIREGTLASLFRVSRAAMVCPFHVKQILITFASVPQHNVISQQWLIRLTNDQTYHIARTKYEEVVNLITTHKIPLTITLKHLKRKHQECLKLYDFLLQTHSVRVFESKGFVSKIVARPK